MTCDIILCGVGGQGGLSVSVVIARAAMAFGLRVKQSELHGMSQRGGEVLAHLRISDREINSPTIPKGRADIIFAFEPLEALRHLSWLSAERGTVVAATTPTLNIPNYPDIDSVLEEIRKIPRARLIDADALAKQAGNVRSANLVLIGAAADLLPIPSEAIEKEIVAFFSKRGKRWSRPIVRHSNWGDIFSMHDNRLCEKKLSTKGKALRDEALRIVARAKREGRHALTELEGMALLSAMGIRTPKFWLVASADDFLDKIRQSTTESPKTGGAVDAATPAVEATLQHLGPFAGAKAVVKLMSPQVLHKTEVQGVEIVENSADAIAAALRRMESRFEGVPRDGFTVNEFVAFEPKLGHEMIFGYRFAPDFGPIVSFGPGGIYTEYLASKFKMGAANLILSPRVSDRFTLESHLRENVVYGLLCAGLRNTRPDLAPAVLQDTIQHFLDAADALSAAGIGEFEVNPMVLSRAGELVALDCLVTLKDFSSMGLAQDEDGLPVNMAQRTRPVQEIGRILKPASAAVIGVSEKNVNNGRIILRNLIQNGFDTSRLYVVKAGVDSIDGCRCVPDVASLPEKVDLFALAIPAAATPATLADVARHDKAWTIIVFPGGLEEKEGSGAIVAEMRRALAEARSQGKGPLINGGNCLGIRSVPGKYNTLFIPEYKLPLPKGKVEPLALISQSGAFAITRLSKHPGINPKYTFTLGNQMDLTVGDYLDYLAQDPELHVFAVYIEGFQPLDGEKMLEATRRISDSGRSVIVYRGAGPRREQGLRRATRRALQATTR